MRKANELWENRDTEIAQGKQYNMSDSAASFGFPLPVYVTSELRDKFIVPDEKSRNMGEDENTRFKQILDRLIYAIRIHRQKSKSSLMRFDVSLTVDGKSEKVDLVSYIGRKDIESNDPSITLALADEIH